MKFFTASILIATAIAINSVSAVDPTQAPANATTDTPVVDPFNPATVGNTTEIGSTESSGSEDSMDSSTSSSSSGSGKSAPTVGDASGPNAGISLQSITFITSAIVATVATAVF